MNVDLLIRLLTRTLIVIICGGINAASVCAQTSIIDSSAAKAASYQKTGFEDLLHRLDHLQEAVHELSTDADSNSFVAEISDVRQQLERRVPFQTGIKATEKWLRAASTVFNLSLYSEWKDEPQAEDDLKRWWQAVANVPSGSVSRAKLSGWSLSLTLLFLQRWAAIMPEAADRLVTEAQSRFAPMAQPAVVQRWKGWVADFDVASETSDALRRVPTERRAGMLAHANTRLIQYWNDPSVLLANQTISVADYAHNFYNEGQLAQAISILDAWQAKHPEATSSVEFCTMRFFASCVGQGNLDVGRMMLTQMDQLVERGTISKEDPHYLLVTQSYYKHLSMNECERVAYGNQLMAKSEQETN